MIKIHPSIEGIAISQDGKVYNLDKGIEIIPRRKICKDTKPYLRFYFNGNTYYLHKEIARTWIINNHPSIQNQVDHIDRNIHNNSLENLRWSSNSGNQKNRSIKAYQGVRLSHPRISVPEILRLRYNKRLPYHDISLMYNIGASAIHSICKGIRYNELSKQTRFWKLMTSNKGLKKERNLFNQ